MLKIDLNCDLGEGFGQYIMGNDDEILNHVTSINIACGFHAGDPLIMDKTVKLALEKGVAIGAHPGYADLLGFGRRNMTITPEEARAYIIYQVGALYGFVKAHGAKLSHVKPHGALYNMAAKDYKLARALAEGVYQLDSSLIFVGLANSMLTKAAEDVGLSFANEVFADRAYNRDGSLVARNIEGAFIHDENKARERVIKMIKAGQVVSLDGYPVDIKADTLCIHGDNPRAVEFAKELRARIISEGILLQSLGGGI